MDRINRRLPVVALGVAMALSMAGICAAEDLTDRAARVRDAALMDQTAWTLLSSLTTTVGARPVGSLAMARARDWALQTLQNLGFKHVRAERFTTRAWSRGTESAQIVGPHAQSLSLLGLGNATPTPPGGLQAQFVIFRRYQDLLSQPRGSLTGKIVVVTERMPRRSDVSAYAQAVQIRARGASEAAKRGALAFLLRSLTTADARLAHTGVAYDAGIPQAALSSPDADQLERIEALGEPTQIRLVMASSVRTDAEAWNIVGDIPGEADADDVVIVGGHLDSWDPGTGAVDDGSGVAMTIAAAKIAAAGGPLRRTIRVVLWGSEEQSGSSDAFLSAHQLELGHVVVAGESDNGADDIVALHLPSPTRDRSAMTAFAAAMKPLHLKIEPEPPRESGSDISGIVKAGVPFVEFDPDMSRYFDFHHSADDTLDKVKPDGLAQNVAVWATFLYVAGNSGVRFKAR